MLIRVFLLLTAGAFALFFAGWIVQKSFSVSLAESVNILGAKTLLAGYALLFVVGVFCALKSAAEEISDYFSIRQSVRRKVLFAQAKLRDMERLRSNEQRQLNYFNALKRASLLHANNNKHIRLLADSISLRLYRVRDNMPRPLYKNLKNAIRRHRRHQDCEALLSLLKQFDVYE